MQVTLLGTSGAEGWPALFCRCEACGKARTMGGKNIRTRTSALIDGGLKIDFPPDTLHHVIQYNLDLRCLNALLFTHAHDDHCSPAELQYLGNYFVTTPVPEPLQVYGSKNVIHRIEHTLDLQRVPVKPHKLQPWKPVHIDNYLVTPILAQHDPTQVCFNYLIEDSDGVTLLYATDTGWYEEPTWQFLEKFAIDGVVVECAKGPCEGGYMAHMSIPDVVRLRQKLIAMGSFHADSPMVTTHFSHLGGLMHDELEALLKPHNIQPGYDGMIFQVEKAASLTASARK